MGEMLASVQKIDRLDRRACRVHLAERVSVERTGDGCEAASGGSSTRRSQLLIGRWMNQLLWPRCQPAWARSPIGVDGMVGGRPEEIAGRVP